MYLPNAQSVIAAGLALSDAVIRCLPLLPDNLWKFAANIYLAGKTVSSGEILDYAVPACIDEDGNQRCSKPFPVVKDKCYNIEWKSDGLLSHTTVEVRDAGSKEIVYYRDTNGEWTADKTELVYLDFKPKVWKTGNATVEYTVETCTK